MRPARPRTRASPLLYESAAAVLRRLRGRRGGARGAAASASTRARGHTASWEVLPGGGGRRRVVGVLAGFPSREGDRLARRFVRADAAARCRRGAGRGTLRHLRAAGTLSPAPAGRRAATSTRSRSTPACRRRGVARALLAEAEPERARAGLRGVALDTGLRERAAPARSTRPTASRERDVRRAPDDAHAPARSAAPGFVSYFKAA